MRNLFPFVLVLTLFGLAFAQTETQSAVIPQHTAVEIELLDNLSSETLRAGQSIAFKVVRPVVVNGTTVIAADMPVSGEVKAVQRSGHWHKEGVFDLILQPIRLDDGSIIQLDFHRPQVLSTRKENIGIAIEGSLALTYYYPLIPFALIGGARKGKPYEIRSGERYLVYVVSSKRPAAGGTSETVPGKSTEPPKP